MVRVAFVVYREWGFEIFKNILEFQKQRGDFALDTLILPESEKFTIPPAIKKQTHIYYVDPTDNAKIYELLKKNEIDITCCYSWSWFIKDPILTDFICLCLHPSPVPRYRGGTPIQNQIIAGEEQSAVSIFRMAEGVDDGPIYKQAPISFLGSVQDIFRRMIDVGIIMTKQLIEDAITGELSFTPQKDLEKYPALKRRKPSQSEIKKEELESMKYKDLYNLVRGLLDPYPNAFIQLEEKKLYVIEVTRYKILPKDALLVNEISTAKKLKKQEKLFAQVKDGYARILAYKIG